MRTRSIKKRYQILYDGVTECSGFPSVTVEINGKSITNGGLLVREITEETVGTTTTN